MANAVAAARHSARGPLQRTSLLVSPTEPLLLRIHQPNRVHHARASHPWDFWMRGVSTHHPRASQYHGFWIRGSTHHARASHREGSWILVSIEQHGAHGPSELVVGQGVCRGTKCRRSVGGCRGCYGFPSSTVAPIVLDSRGPSMLARPRCSSQDPRCGG